MKYLYVYRGRPAMYAEGMLALLHMRGHAHRKIERSDVRAAVAIRLRGRQDWVEYDFTIGQAEQAGYLGQNAKYKTDPWSMLWARVVTIAIRSECPEILGGLDGEADVVDIVESEAVDVTARVTVEDLAARATAAPVAVEQAVAQAAEQAAVPMIEQNTWKALNREWTRLGVNGPGAVGRRMEAIVRLIDRPIDNGSDLTAEEAAVLLDTLSGIDPARHEHAVRLAEILDEPAPAPPGTDAAAADEVPEPDDAERAAAAAAEQEAALEPKGWEK